YELAFRYYYDSQYANGGEEEFKKSTAALERAVALDPNYVDASSALISNHVERGQLGKSYKEARELVRRRPESAAAHFSVAYTARYSGEMNESGRECETAIALDPGNFLFRSCSITFGLLGQADRGMDFLNLDAGSEWAAINLPDFLIRQNKPQ